MPENRSCPEFILNPLLVNEFKLAVNCANCKRWVLKLSKCREMIWVKEWVEWMTAMTLSRNANTTHLLPLAGSTAQTALRG